MVSEQIPPFVKYNMFHAEFATIAVAHNVRKMITKGYGVCSEVAVVIYKEKRR